MYLVTETNLASQIYRSSKSFNFDPLALLVSVVFGCSKKDMEILERGANDYTVKPSSQIDDKEPLLKQLHHMSSTELQGDSLNRMTSEFVRKLRANIDAELPAADTEWREIELVEFVKRQFTLASISSLLGTKLLEQNGVERVYSWFWKALDPHAPALFTKLPDWILSGAARSRNFGLEMMVRWEREAKRAEERGNIGKEGESWNEYWGLGFMRDRARMVEEYGISERGRAALQLALLWGCVSGTHLATRMLTDQTKRQRHPLRYVGVHPSSLAILSTISPQHPAA
jgi:hypothetical protein